MDTELQEQINVIDHYLSHTYGPDGYPPAEAKEAQKALGSIRFWCNWMRMAFAEPCAECGHVDWRAEDEA